MKAYWRSLRQMERSSGLYLTAWAMVSFGYFGVQAVLLNLYLLHLGFDTAYIGNFLALGQLAWAIAGLPAGLVGTRVGLRAALVAGLGLVSAGWAVMLLAENLPHSALGVGLLAGWILSWVGAALYTVNGLPYQMGVTTDANRSYVFSFQQASQAIFALLGGLAAGVLPGLLVRLWGGNLSEGGSYRAVLWLLPLTNLIGLLALLRARPVVLASSSGPTGERFGAPLGIFAFFSLIVLLESAGEGGARQLFNLYLHDGINLPTSQIGAIFGFSQLAPLVAALLIPLLLARMNSGNAVGLGSLLMTLAMLILTLSATPFVAAAGLFSMLLASSMLAITRAVFSQQIVDERWRPMINALATIFTALGWAGSAAYGGIVSEQVGFNNLFRATAVLVTLAGLIALAYVRASAVRSRQLAAGPIPVTAEEEAE